MAIPLLYIDGGGGSHDMATNMARILKSGRQGDEKMIYDLASKLTQVIEQIPKEVLYDFLCSYAQSHDELAMVLGKPSF